MFWQRQLNPFHVVEFQTGAILMLIQVGWRKNSSTTTVHSTSRAEPPSKPSSESSRICWCQVLVVYSSHCSHLLHMMLWLWETKKTIIWHGEGDGGKGVCPPKREGGQVVKFSLGLEFPIWSKIVFFKKIDQWTSSCWFSRFPDFGPIWNSQNR